MSESENKGRVYFVGAGPGDPELITVKGARLIGQADLVLYAGSLVPEEIVNQARAGAKVADSSGMTLEQTHALIMETVNQGGMAARVHTGDPSLYGAVQEQKRLLEAEGVICEVVPGVTAAFAAAAQAQVSFTVPEQTQSLVITRLGGRTPVPEAEGLAKLAGHGCAMAVYLSGGKVGELADQCREAGLPADTTVVVGHRLGWPGQWTKRTTLADLAKDTADQDIKNQTVFLILPDQDSPTTSKLYDAEFSHGCRGIKQDD